MSTTVHAVQRTPSSVHAPESTPRTDPVRTGRRRPVLRAPQPPRVEHPKACCTSTAVRTGAVEPVEQIRALNAQDKQSLIDLFRDADNPERVRQHVRRMARRATLRDTLANGAVGYLHGPLAALEHAEKACDWDALADLRAFTSGRRIASELIPILDEILRAEAERDLGARARACLRLRPWFDAHGDMLVRTVVLKEVGAATRAPALLVEHKAWRAGRAA